MTISLTGSGAPLADQIQDQILGLITTGLLPAGPRLPSAHQSAIDLGVAPGTAACRDTGGTAHPLVHYGTQAATSCASEVRLHRLHPDNNFLGGKLMDILLPVVFTSIFFYILYGVIRAGTRDGIIAARKAEKTEAKSTGDFLSHY